MIYGIRNRATGEHANVSSLEGFDLDEWELVGEAEGDPEELNDFENVTGAGRQRDVHAETDSLYGPEAISKAHTLKALEAAMVLSGVNLTCGILVEEAQALGMPLIELAEAVHDKAKSFREAEVTRREIKTQGDV